MQLPDSTQGFNRYAYVQNNPLKYTDPSGFFLSGLFNAVGNMFSAMGSQLLAGLNSITRFVQTYGTTLFAIAIASVPGLNVVAAGFISGLVSGGNLKSAVLGAIGAGMFSAIGAAAKLGSWGTAARTFAHGMGGGVMSKLSGGSFKAGFLSGGFTQFASRMNVFGKASSSAGFGSRIRNAFSAAAVGGVASVLGGGKFKNGAMTGAFSRMFNDFAFHVDKLALGGLGHTSLYFQDEMGNWHAYDQMPSGSDMGLLVGADVDARVTIVDVARPPTDSVMFSTTPEQDSMISDTAYLSADMHNSGAVKYNLYSNNCTDASVDVINYSNVGIRVNNSPLTIQPNSWIEEIK